MPAAPAPSAATATAVPAGDPTALAEERPRLWQLDVVRLLTFGAVIAVHLLAFTEQPANRGVAGAMMLLQFGREVFFALTGFVLIYSTWGRPLRAGSFWRRRVPYVAVPYLAWSVIYWAYSLLGPAHLPLSWSAFGWDLLYGGAEYHLYFLLVTLQLYLVFPLILWFVRRTAHRAIPVLAVVAVLNLTVMAVMQYAPLYGMVPLRGTSGWLYTHAYELLPTYLLYVLAGCYAAVHLPRLQAAYQRHPGRLLALAGVAAAGAVASYAAQLPLMAPRLADAVLQPAMVLSCLAAAIVLYGAGARWAAGPRRHQRLIETLSDASFGVYLAHPLILQFLLDYLGFGNTGLGYVQSVPPAVATFAGFAITAGITTALVVLARRTPVSLALTGRPWGSAVRHEPATARQRAAKAWRLRMFPAPQLARARSGSAC